VKNGDGICVGGSASANKFDLTPPYKDYLLTNQPLKNGGAEMTCWNPKESKPVQCTAGDWSCKVRSKK